MGLLRGAELVGHPVVTLGGEDIAEIRDVLFDAARGVLIGFTLNKRGRLSGRMSEVLAQSDVVGIGPEAVMVRSAESLSKQLPTHGIAGGRKPIGNVLDDRVLTDSGLVVGTVTDVVIDTDVGAVVGFEIAPSTEAHSRHSPKSYLPFEEMRSVSGDTLVVPGAVTQYITADFAGFAQARDRYRTDIAAKATS
jgi:uncharacterized protein YrrD